MNESISPSIRDPEMKLFFSSSVFSNVVVFCRKYYIKHCPAKEYVYDFRMRERCKVHCILNDYNLADDPIIRIGSSWLPFRSILSKNNLSITVSKRYSFSFYLCCQNSFGIGIYFAMKAYCNMITNFIVSSTMYILLIQ